MAAAAQSYLNPMLSDTLPTPGFFTAAIAGDENLNIFENSFKDGTATPGQSQDADNGESHFLRSFPDEVFSPLFGLSPNTQSPAPLPPAPTTDPEGRVSRSQQPQLELPALKLPAMDGFADLKPQVPQQPSPPRSSKSPDEYPARATQDLSNSLSQILTHNPASGTRAQHGQVTPPDDQSPNPAQQDTATSPSPVQPLTAPTKNTSSPKRKRTGAQNGPASSTIDNNPPKRQRKSSAKSKASVEEEETTGDNEEDVKRTRFLERNRVAASKCRQKKKEWTNNLEARARELQNSKNQLAMMVSSLKDEVLYLKGELLKHTNCNCTRIREYMNQEVTNLSHRNSYPQHMSSLGMPLSITDSPQMSAAIPSRSGSISFPGSGPAGYQMDSSPMIMRPISAAGSVSPLNRSSPLMPQLKIESDMI